MSHHEWQRENSPHADGSTEFYRVLEVIFLLLQIWIQMIISSSSLCADCDDANRPFVHLTVNEFFDWFALIGIFWIVWPFADSVWIQCAESADA